MSKQIPWNKFIVEEFIKEACLTDVEEMVLRTRVKGWTISKQAYELGLSESAVHKIVARLKKKYDLVQKYNPLLPPRKSSVQETYMDKN